MKLHTGEMDAYEMYLWKQLKQHESKRCRKQQLPPLVPYPSRRASNDKYFECIVETYILVATLIATVTFAATSSVPGGYDDDGIAVHRNNIAFNIFIISNTVAMCSSIVVVFCFIWAWQDPVRFKVNQLLWGHRLTVIACLAMLVSLMTAVYITVAPESPWPSYVVIVIGVSTPAVVVLMLGKEVIFVPM
jgi:magnesium-transporting ATPase (P-type)